MCEHIESFRWKNIIITSNDANIDYYVIINYPQKNSFYDPSKTIVFQMKLWVHNPDLNWV